jgi:hypothetical protein
LAGEEAGRRRPREALLGAVEAAVKEKLWKFCRWLCVDERERGQCWGCWQRMRGKGEGCPGLARGVVPCCWLLEGKRKSSRLGERRGR